LNLALKLEVSRHTTQPESSEEEIKKSRKKKKLNANQKKCPLEKLSKKSCTKIICL
jgi:hypothetical protein